ncbi:MAG: hypothetical protein GKR99_01875 [Rhodobacteraceae bacterium]|nr:hypothetical protein [Paracoccaceae bacterium]
MPVTLHYIDVPRDIRWDRVQQRNTEKGATFALEVTREMFEFIEDLWEAPTEAEMSARNGVMIGA